MPPKTVPHYDEAASKFQSYLRSSNVHEPENAFALVQYDRLQRHGYHALLSVCVQACLLRRIISFQLKLELARGVLDPLEEDVWTSPRNGNDIATKCKAARLSFLKTDVRKSPMRPIWDNALSFRTIACASKQVAVIHVKL